MATSVAVRLGNVTGYDGDYRALTDQGVALVISSHTTAPTGTVTTALTARVDNHNQTGRAKV